MEEEFHNHMRIPWHDYTRKSIGRPITEASLSESLDHRSYWNYASILRNWSMESTKFYEHTG